MRATVVALGDLGLSARMRYHAQALASSGVDVDLVGFEGTTLPAAIVRNPRITVHRLEPSTLRQQLPGSTYVAAGLLDASRLSRRLWWILRRLPRPDLVLVQNPPAFPSIVVAWVSLRRRGVRFVIDWHNLGYTLLRGRLGRWHPAVRLARWFERRDARRADANLCVSRGLAMFLETRFGADAHVLYDRPAALFVPLPDAEREQYRQAFFARLGVHASDVGLVVCPTSWTEDEDFDLAIEAVSRLEERVRGWEAAHASRRFPNLVILVTGDGARRARFERRFAGLQARRIHLRARWLEPEDYPKVIASADVGLSLHRSSSGLDIPMKVADLFGAGVPVCALDYGACLAERVRHADNGLLFSSAPQLANILFDLFETFPVEQSLLNRLRGGARRSARTTWEEGWQREARAILLPGH